MGSASRAFQRWLSRLLAVFVLVAVLYQAGRVRGIYLQKLLEYNERLEFLESPVSEKNFLAHEKQLSHHARIEGALLPALRTWIETSLVYSLLSFNSVYLQAGTGLLAALAMWLFAGYMKARYETDRLTERADRLDQTVRNGANYLRSFARTKNNAQHRAKFSNHAALGGGASSATATLKYNEKSSTDYDGLTIPLAAVN